MIRLKSLMTAGLILFALFFQSAPSHAVSSMSRALPGSSNASMDSQNPQKEFFVESDGYKVNLSSVWSVENDLYLLKMVMKVETKEGAPYLGPLRMRVLKKPLWGEEKQVAAKEFSVPYEDRYMFRAEIKKDGDHKIAVAIPGARGDVSFDFSVTVGNPGNGLPYIVAAFSVLGLLAFVIASKRRKGRTPEKYNGSHDSMVST